MVVRIAHSELSLLICSSKLPFFGWDSYFFKEAIFFCMVGLPLFGEESSGTPVFKILVRALTLFL